MVGWFGLVSLIGWLVGWSGLVWFDLVWLAWLVGFLVGSWSGFFFLWLVGQLVGQVVGIMVIGSDFVKGWWLVISEQFFST